SAVDPANEDRERHGRRKGRHRRRSRWWAAPLPRPRTSPGAGLQPPGRGPASGGEHLYDAEELGRFAQVRDLGGRLALAGVERLLVAVDPDHRDLRLHAGLDVVVVARRHVDPALLPADPARALVEVGEVGLVGAHLLRRQDEVEVDRDVAARLAEQLVVDVRDQTEPGLLRELVT